MDDVRDALRTVGERLREAREALPEDLRAEVERLIVRAEEVVEAVEAKAADGPSGRDGSGHPVEELP